MKRLAILGFGVFVVLGAAVAMYGPLFPQLRVAFALPESDAGALVGWHCLGGLAGIVLWTVGELRGGLRGIFAASLVCFAVGAMAVALAPGWGLVRAGGLLVGVGFGSLVLGINRSFAAGFGERSGAMLNLVNACFSVAAVAGPLAIAITPGSHRRTLFAGLAVLALLLVPLLSGLSLGRESRPEDRDDHDEPDASESDDPDTRAGRPSVLIIALFMGLFMLYIAVESSIGAWEATYLVSRGHTAESGAAWTSAFWGALTVGRLIAAPISLRIHAGSLVVASVLLVVVGVVATRFSGMEAGAFAVVGLGMAAIFPTSFAWLSAALPAARTAGGMALAAGMVGGILGPPTIGYGVARFGVGIVPWGLTILAVLCLLCSLALYRLVPRR